MNTNLLEMIKFAEFSNAIGQRIDYVQGGGGNTSYKVDDQTMLIKASGYYLTQVKENDGFAILDYPKIVDFFYSDTAKEAEDIEKAGSELVKESILKVEDLPELRPSVESGFHSILRRWVAHTHSVYSNIILCSEEAEKLLKNIFEGEKYIYVPYVNPGSRLTLEIAQRMEDFKQEHDGELPTVIFMQNHGIIVHADDMQECFDLHESINEQICQHFGISSQDYPDVNVQKLSENEYISSTDYLSDSLKTKEYTTESLLTYPLYPDQIVYLKEILGEKAIIQEDGKLLYKMPYKQAILLEEALTAIVYIMNNIKEQGLKIQFMHQSQQNFINNWESEKYRKELAEK